MRDVCHVTPRFKAGMKSFRGAGGLIPIKCCVTTSKLKAVSFGPPSDVTQECSVNHHFWRVPAVELVGSWGTSRVGGEAHMSGEVLDS